MFWIDRSIEKKKTKKLTKIIIGLCILDPKKKTKN